MFSPPRCPHRECSQHRSPNPQFFVRHGSYRPKCRPWPVPRFRCRSCRRTFSRQTFRADYRDHKPDRNVPLFLSLTSGVGLRQTARSIGLSQRCTELKFRKIARHLRRLNLSLQTALAEEATLHFDELETYEGQRNTRPLSVPILLESESRFLIWAESAPIRPRGKLTEKRAKAIRDSELRHGKRRDLSRRSVQRTLARAAAISSGSRRITLETDEKSSYPTLAQDAFGEDRLLHLTTNSKLARMTWNPLFAVNHEEAILRDLLGRVRRESWLVSKKRRYLDLGLQMHMAYRNFVRRRFNYDSESPAQMLGFVERRLTPWELLSWRQDWGSLSCHPLGRSGETIEARRKRAA